MLLKRLMEIASEMNVQVETHKLTGGRTGVFIPLERIEGGEACVIPLIETAPLMRYLDSSDAEWKYIGNYSGIMVMLPADTKEGGTAT